MTHVYVILYHSTQFHVFETSRTLVRLVLSQTPYMYFIVTVPDFIKFTYYHCTSIDYSVLYE